MFALWKPFSSSAVAAGIAYSEAPATNLAPVQGLSLPPQDPSNEEAKSISSSARALIEPPRSVCRGRSGEWCSEVPPPSSPSCRPNASAAVSEHCPCRAQFGR